MVRSARSARFALLAPTISLSSLHELGHRSWEVSIIQKGVQRSRNCLDSQRVDLRARPRGGVPRHREEASARRQKIQKTQRDEDPSPPLPPPGQCQKFRLYVQSATVCRFLTLDTLVLQTQACKPSPPPPSRVAVTSHATTAFPTIAVASASKATAAFPAAASKAAAAVAVASKARVPSQSALRVPSECPLSAL